LDAIDAAINDSGDSIAVAMAHLGGLILVFGAAAWAGLRRFA
jgi:hypothetical protein